MRCGVIVSACIAFLQFSPVFAALKADAPKGVDLSGRWKLSPELSEDPHAAVGMAREEMKEKERGEEHKKKKPRQEFKKPRKESEEPKESAPPDWDPLERAVTSPEEFAIQQEPGSFVLMTADATDTCKTKRPGQVNVPGYGLTDRKCGWDKTGFVVEVEPKRGPLNITRYEMDKASGRLFVTSELKGERIPKISVKRVYVRVEPAD